MVGSSLLQPDIILLRFGPYRLSHGKHLIAEQFDAAGEDDWEPPYNIAPTQPVPIICQHPKEPRPERSLVRWGLFDGA